MKRTAEIVLGTIGALIYALFAVLGGVMIWMQNNEEVVRESFEQTAEQNPSVNIEDFNTVIESMGASGWVLLIVSLVAFLLGMIAIVLLKGNKNPKAAGIIFIITSVGIAIITLGAGIIPGIFYLIAGVMCFARKEPRTLDA